MTTRLGFIGLGLIARMHWEYLATRDDVELTAFCDIDESRLHPPAGQYNAKAFVDYKEMITETELDAVYICVPPYVDGQMELDCLAAGLHLFVEKPVALDMATARKVEADIQHRDAVCAVGYHWRYMGAAELTQEMLGEEEIGFMQGRWLGPMPGAFWWPELRLSGGQMHEQCTHIIDLARYFGGEITQVTAAGAKTIVHKRVAKHDIWDAQAACLTFANGIVASMHTSHLAAAAPSVGLNIYTPESCFEIGEAPWSSKLTVRRRGQVLHYRGQDRGWREPRFDENDAFIHAVRTGDRSKIRSDYSDAIKTLAVTLAINRACETNEVVNISEMD